MGTINYGSNDYINLGVDVNNLHNTYGYEDDDFYLEIDFLYEDIERILNKYSFYYYHVVLKPGYYEGFYLDIENNFPLCYDDYVEKAGAQKEITQIKAFLLECTECGLVQYFPGWGMGYNDYEGTKKAISEAIKDMRSEAKSIPTWQQYKKCG